MHAILRYFALSVALVTILISDHSFELTAAEKSHNAKTKSSQSGLPLVHFENFERGAASWEPTDAKAWRITKSNGGNVYEQFVKRSKYEPPVRSPYNRSLLKDVHVGSFILDVKVKSTHPDYGHRDMCLFFGYQDPAHLYYVHLGKKMDDHANNIFIVNGTPRKKISTKTTPGTNWDDEWHRVRIVRNVDSGEIRVYFNDFENPIMLANDKNFTWGQVGIGSFDDTGMFDDLFLFGDKVQPKKTQPKPKKTAQVKKNVIRTTASEKKTNRPEVLAKTKPLTITEPLDEVMIAGLDKFCLREIDNSIASREKLWSRNYANAAAYQKSVAPNRARFLEYIGAVDPRVKSPEIEIVSSLQHDGVVGVSEGKFKALSVRWPVLKGITGEGILLQPEGKPVARVIAIPDADWTPEMFAGLKPGVSARSLIPKRLAENGVQVLIPMLISRDDKYSGSDYVAYTNQSHREYVYRMAFEMGRHVIGYEVQKVLAAVDAFEKLNADSKTKIPTGVIGVGEGGLLALYSAAADQRIASAAVCGYFQQRETVWDEPIYRNVWGLLSEFGDAGIASLIAPRPLTIEPSAVPEVAGPHKPKPGRRGGAAPGKIEVSTLASVRIEYDRAKVHYDKLKAGDKIVFSANGEGANPAGIDDTLNSFLQGLGVAAPVKSAGPAVKTQTIAVDADARQKRQIEELTKFTQDLLLVSAKVRDKRWSKADRTSLETWKKTIEDYRDSTYDTLIGRLPHKKIAANPRTRKILEDPAYTGYEVVLDVYPDVIASGILLLPTDLKPGEKRPVVVCQHGLEGVPMDTISGPGTNGNKYYKSFAAELAKRGFITYAPQNPYRGRDRFRTLQRKSNPLRRSLFSYIIPQHERTLEWLSTLPNVDPTRIGFYGLSYGGKTAVRVPPFIPQYALSICSADFDEWVLKNATDKDRYSYLFTGEYEIFEWNMGHVANYAELSNLMTPRPFMVERGHFDGVAPDEWVAWEYAKIRRHYNLLGIGDKTEIEFFIGPHTINGQGTFAFLHRHLNWPVPKK